MLHFVDRFMAFIFGETCHAPVVEQAVVQPVLVDGRQLVAKRDIEMLDDLRIALHGSPLVDCASA
jgi:hypothetical protein